MIVEEEEVLLYRPVDVAIQQRWMATDDLS